MLIGSVLAAVAATGSAGAVQLGEGTPLPLEGYFTAPLWSPAGGGLALAGENFQGLYYTDMLGNLMTVSDAALAGWRFNWSPDGQHLAYRAREDEGSGMALMVAGTDGESKQVTPYLNDMFPPKWGKDGLTYRSGDELVTVDKDGKVTKVRSLSQGRGMLSRIASIAGSLMLGHVTGATFTAFGALLSSQALDGKQGKGVFLGPDNQIWTVDEAGKLKKLIDVENVAGYTDPVESPDGGKYATHGFDGNLYIADPKSDQPVNLGAGSNPTWSPDGRYVIFERTTDDGQRILTSDLWMASWDGSWVYQLTSTGVIEGYPSWSPDGSWIAYVIDGVVYIAPIEI